MTVEKQSYVQPPGPPDPGRRPGSPTSSPRCSGSTAPRPGLRGLRPLRLPGHRRAELHQRRARRRRRRLRRRGLDGAGPGPGDARARGDDRVRRRRRRGAGPLRLRPTWPSSSRRPARTCRACSPTTSSAARTADDGTRDPKQPAAVRRRRADRRDRRRRPPSAQSVGGENDSPARQLARFVTEVADNRATGMRRAGRSTGATASCAAGDHISFLEQRLPGRPLHRAERELRPPAPGRARRERRAVRRPAAVLRLRLHRAGGPGERRDAVVAGQRPRHPEERAGARPPSSPTTPS